MNRDEIMSRLGAENWQMVVQAYGDYHRTAILEELNELFPTDNNAELAFAIYKELN